MPVTSELFTLDYGHSLELNRLEQSHAPDAVNFVSRMARNNGVGTRVCRIPNLDPISPGTISVALNGQGGAGVAFLQPAPYYSGFHIMVLTPKTDMTEREKLWWTMCITANRFRFGFGRQANRTLKDLVLPDPEQIPHWVETLDVSKSVVEALSDFKELSTAERANAPEMITDSRVHVSDLFEVQVGTNLELVRMTRQSNGVNFVSRTARNNGVSARVAPIQGISPTPGGVLSVAGGGSVLETFVQIDPFYSGRDLFVLRPKVSMNTEELMFYATCVRANQSRFSYGRQANRTLKDLLIPDQTAIPAWVYGSISRVVSKFVLL